MCVENAKSPPYIYICAIFVPIDAGNNYVTLLCAGFDTLPIPLNLAKWNIIINPVCVLCQSTQPTSNHILTGCSVALDQGRYTLGTTIQFCRFLFIIFRKFCCHVSSRMLISQATLLVLVLVLSFRIFHHP